jgi:hypothetical protein
MVELEEAMEQHLTIANLNQTASDWITKESQRTGMSVEDVVRHLIYQGIHQERQKIRRQIHHDLDALAGTWSSEDADAFRQATTDMNRIDPSMWV